MSDEKDERDRLSAAIDCLEEFPRMWPKGWGNVYKPRVESLCFDVCMVLKGAMTFEGFLKKRGFRWDEDEGVVPIPPEEEESKCKTT